MSIFISKMRINKAGEIKHKAIDSCIFLPEHLFEEVMSDTKRSVSESMKDFDFDTLYLDQIIQILPRDYTEKSKLSTAFEDEIKLMVSNLDVAAEEDDNDKKEETDGVLDEYSDEEFGYA